MSRFRKLSHTIWHCQYHVIWVPKYRFRVLTGRVASEVERCIRAFSEHQKGEVIELNVQVDHVHLLVFWNCWVRSAVRKRFLYPLLAVALLILLGMALVSCDPILNEYEIWILSVLVAILALAWLYYYIRKVKQGELP